MRFAFGYAGIPSHVYDEVYKERHNICGDNATFVSQPLREKHGVLQYTESHANFFLREFAELIRADHHNDLRDTGFAVIYVRHEEPSGTLFLQRFFPSTLCIGVDWRLTLGSEMVRRQSKNQLIQSLRAATNEARSALPSLKKEVTERGNRTPLLLPVRNFDSKHLRQELVDLQEALGRVRDKIAAINATVSSLEFKHPQQRRNHRSPRYFVDDRDVEYHPPGSDRHGFARGQGGHPETCLLSGRRRLGAPYDHVFHYDCLRRGGKLVGLFFGCHEEPSVRHGSPHLNISPNDHVRP